jgi:cytochrome c oxidase subunit 2
VVETREEYGSLAGLYLPIAIGVFAIVAALLLFTLIRYRRRDDRLPRQREGFPVLESLYAAAIAAIVVVLVAATFSAEDEVDAVSDHPGLEVDVIAFQWGWRFTYPGDVTVVGDDLDPPNLIVPTDTTVRFNLRARDVIHAFWIPETRFKRDAFPERETSFDLVFEEGDTVGRCAEFCGLKHADMTFDVLPLPPTEFDEWLGDERHAPNGRRADGRPAEPAP